MEIIQLRAGKRNVVNTYVWDGDGGLRAEEQSFASTVEHSMSAEFSNEGGSGAASEALVAGFKFDMSLLGSGGSVSGTGKTLSTAKNLQLTVDLSGVEKRGITDSRDNPKLLRNAGTELRSLDAGPEAALNPMARQQELLDRLDNLEGLVKELLAKLEQPN